MSKVCCGLLLAVPTLNRYEGLVELLESAEAGYVTPEAYLAIDNGGGLAEFLLDPRFEGAPWMDRVRLKVPGKNLGVAASWNAALDERYAWTLIAGDDCVFEKDSIEKLMDAARARPEFGFYSPVVHPLSQRFHSEWACFLQTRLVTDRVGYYDEVFFPGWFEDDDYRKRMSLVGLRPAKVTESVIRHVGGATSEVASLNDESGVSRSYNERWNVNQARYVEKWGGRPGQETVTAPRLPIRR